MCDIRTFYLLLSIRGVILDLNVRWFHQAGLPTYRIPNSHLSLWYVQVVIGGSGRIFVVGVFEFEILELILQTLRAFNLWLLRLDIIALVDKAFHERLRVCVL